ncbi:DASS family sodium-coupled anion symporter [Candidatus Sumerlaeota bacterium]|nr:DASS family sodium-coupled anion symporter [Candidatus Sumerlaeota bacterium]
MTPIARPARRRLTGKQIFQRVGGAVAVIAFLIPWVFEFEGLSPEGHRVLSIMLLAVVLWVTEAIPLHATAAVIIFLEILTISSQGVMPLSEGFEAPSQRTFYTCLADPVLMLFLGGFFLADGAAKFDLDRNLARVLLRPFGASPSMILLGLMMITALFSMFMSNTATTATMMAVVIPVIAQLPPGDRMRTGFALAIPVAANIGGIGTPIGTPPNAIALGALANAGIAIGFVQWMIMAIPFMVVILLAAWLLLARMFRSSEQSVTLTIESEFDTRLSAKVFYMTFAITILLWLTENLHGMSSSVVGFFPVVIMLSTRIFTTKDMQSIQWHILWLLAGGIALGVGLGRTGLDAWLVGLVDWQSLSAFAVTAALALMALLLGSFISHTATANLLVPIGMSLAASDAVAVSPVLAAVFIAIGASLAMSLPVSTPPNAIAMSTGTISVSQMAIVGVTIGIFGYALFLLFAPWLWNLLGVMPG